MCLEAGKQCQVDNQFPWPLTAIPYYAWANREAGPMQVWIPQKL
jgi:DUF1680 family protein